MVRHAPTCAQIWLDDDGRVKHNLDRGLWPACGNWSANDPRTADEWAIPPSWILCPDAGWSIITFHAGLLKESIQVHIFPLILPLVWEAHVVDLMRRLLLWQVLRPYSGRG
jgi:hypothetical protein